MAVLIENQSADYQKIFASQPRYQGCKVVEDKVALFVSSLEWPNDKLNTKPYHLRVSACRLFQKSDYESG